MRAARRPTRANTSVWPPTALACATPHLPTSTCEVGNAASRSKAGTHHILSPSLLGLTASGLPCPLQTQAGGPPARSRQDLGPSGVPLWTSVSLPVKWGQLNPPLPPLCLVMDSQMAAGLGWGRQEGTGQGVEAGVSLEPIGPGEPAGLCPTPPTHPSQLLLWCVVRASLCHVLALLFQTPWPRSSRLTVPSSSALHLKVGEGSLRLPSTASPCTLSCPRAQSSLS